MQVKKFNEEVLVARDSIVKLQSTGIRSLKIRATKNTRKRIRLCVHKNVNNSLHEMFIVHKKETYVRPHKHLHKIESLHIIEGRADIFLFDEKGVVQEIITMGDYLSGHKFYYRIEKPIYHTMIIRSEYLVFHEVTNGPFKRSNTIVAPWSPEESDSPSVKNFLDKLTNEKN